MCNKGAKDNLGQVADFIRLGSGATVGKCPHAGTAAMNARAASGSHFNAHRMTCAWDVTHVPGLRWINGRGR